jgi:hypothetical protein
VWTAGITETGGALVRSKAFLAAVAIAATGGLAVAGSAGAGNVATTKVTIKAPGGEIYGKVKSSRPGRCANDRLIKVYREKGGEQGGGDDILVGTDNSELNGDVGQWSIGNPGVPAGKKVYAKAGRKEGCKRDSSPTIRVEPQ